MLCFPGYSPFHACTWQLCSPFVSVLGLNSVSICCTAGSQQTRWQLGIATPRRIGKRQVPQSHRPVGSVFCAHPLASVAWKLRRITVMPWALVKYFFFFLSLANGCTLQSTYTKRLSMWKCEGQRISDGWASKMHFHFRKQTCLFPVRSVDRNRLPCRHLGFNPCEACSSWWLPCHTQQPYTSSGWLFLSVHRGTDCACSPCLNCSFSAPQKRNRKSIGSSWLSDMAKVRYFLSHTHKPNVDRDGGRGAEKEY